MADPKTDLQQGTLDLVVLRTLDLEPQHGWAVAQRIQQISRDVLQVQQGSLYPALYRLERQGAIRSYWGTTENNRKAKFYELTADGRQRLQDETEQWKLFSTAMRRLLTAT